LLEGTGIYTLVGGLRAVIYTDTMQTVVMLIGGAILTFVCMDAAGGWTQMITNLNQN